MKKQTQVNINEIYPCYRCGECSVWLAAYDVEELQTTEQVINYCKNVRHCDLVGKPVPIEEK